MKLITLRLIEIIIFFFLIHIFEMMPNSKKSIWFALAVQTNDTIHMHRFANTTRVFFFLAVSHLTVGIRSVCETPSRTIAFTIVFTFNISVWESNNDLHQHTHSAWFADKEKQTFNLFDFK